MTYHCLICNGTFQKSFQLPASQRMLQFPDGIGLDLTYTFSGYVKPLADFFQGMGISIVNPEAKL